MSPLSNDKTYVSHFYCKWIHQPCVVLTLWRLSLVRKIIVFNHYSEPLGSLLLCLTVSASSCPLWRHSSCHFSTLLPFSPLSGALLPLPTCSSLPPPLIHPSRFCLLAYLKGNAIVLLPYPESFNDCPQLQKWNLQGMKLSLSASPVSFLCHPSLCSKKDNLAVRFQSGDLYLFTFCHSVPYFY